MTQWWEDHNKLALTARFMIAQDHSIEDVLYMLEKPYKHSDDYNLAQAESELSEDVS